MKINNKTRKFIYLISPNKINNTHLFLKQLEKILKLKKVYFFQLRLKDQREKQILEIGKKIRILCNKYRTKFIVNDSPYMAKKLKADGCHLGQTDMNFVKAKKIIKKKIIGVTCNNSKLLIKKIMALKPTYIAIGAFFRTETKVVKYRADINLLKYAKSITKIPIVAIGGINNKNYKKLLLNNANFLAISSYIWNNKKYKPYQAIKKLK